MLEIGSDQWIDLVLDGAARLGIGLDAQQANLFARHADLLVQWNRKINLTAIVEPTAVAIKHYLDAIAPLAYIPGEGRLLDIGTGGGFPGIPLKIMRPGQSMVLIDSVRKKISFVKQVIRELALDRIEAHQLRAEDMATGQHPKRFEVVVCRALSDLQQVVRWAGPLLSPVGRIVAYRGNVEAHGKVEEVLTLDTGGQHKAYDATHFNYQLPIIGDARSVTVLKPL